MFILLLFFLPLVFTEDYFLTLTEKSRIDRPIYHFSHSYELLNNFQSNFNLTTDKKNLILTKIIDRDTWCAQSICSCEHCSFTLELISNENKTSPNFSTINITIMDLNDHAAQFLDIQTNISLSESIQIGHRFPLARAIDYDSGKNGRLTFRLLENNNIFDLNIIPLSTNEYAIYGIVKHSLDREVKDKYELTIEARDQGTAEVKINRTKVNIWILDENDNAPQFNQTEYSMSLPENTPLGTEFLTITATDADIGLNSLIHYSIITPPGITSFPFTINSTTGIVSLHAALDYETTRSYRFLIRASDSGLPQSLYTDTWLSISVKDVNDCPVDIHFLPNRRFQYDNQTLFIYENTEINNLTLGYIRLYDRDSIPTKLSISLMILDDNPKQEYELIPSNQIHSYVLIVKQGIFDREIQSEIDLRLIANDSLLISNFDLKIHLIDLNDNPSEFSSNPMKFSVEELANYQMNQQQPIEHFQMTIGYLNASDRDEGENALNRYELEFNPFVRIDGQTGRLSLIQPLDREEISKIVLKAKAINIAEPKWETEVTIEIDVLDVNDNIPQCIGSHHRLNLPENYPIDQSLIQIKATDGDLGPNGTIQYFLRANSSWPFEINSQTGEIYSRELFDYESNFKQFFITIELEDQGISKKNRNTNACQIEIVIEDVNDNSPELIDQTQTKIFLDLQKSFNNEISILNVTDRDSGDNGKVKFSLQSNEYDSLFVIFQNGSLQMTRPVTQVSLFSINVLLEDEGQPSRQTTMNIIVAIGDSLVPAFSTFEKVQSKHHQPKSIGLVFGLIILIITIILFCCLILIYILLRRHRQHHQAALLARKKLLCSSSQQLTSSGSTTTTNTTSSTSIEHPHFANIVQIKPTYSQQMATSESNTYKIYHIPQENEFYMNHYQHEKVDTHSSDHGYQGSYETGSSSSPASQVSIHRSYMVNQLPDFVTKCRSVSGGYLIEMNVDGSDEDTKSN